MRFPSKVTSYNDSILSEFPLIIKELILEDLTPEKLFIRLKSKLTDINELIDILSCLYALNEIMLIDEEVLHYVKKN
ncbi:MAG: hypothetical protein RBQ97_06135 [Acholeplasma sp.]|nr:hypothetical protein [Acholeplasma sp.]